MAAKDNSRDKEALPEGQAEKPKKKSKLKKLVIIFAILLMTLTAAGGGAYWWLYMRQPGAEFAEAEGSAPMPLPGPAAPANPSQPAQDELSRSVVERQSSLPRSSGYVLPLPPLTVNLAGADGRRYLKLGMEVEVNADVSSQLKAQSARIRDAIIMLLAGKTYGEISSADGLVLLKAEIAARLNQILGAQRVVRVYFTDFVVE